MRHLLRLLWTVLLTFILLLGCTSTGESPKENTTTSNDESISEVSEDTISVILSKDSGEEVITEEVIEIEKGDILLEIMKESFDVEEENGFIISINGIAAKDGEEKSWIYFVNDEMAMVGASEYEIEPGDNITFDLQAWE